MAANSESLAVGQSNNLLNPRASYMSMSEYSVVNNSLYRSFRSNNSSSSLRTSFGIPITTQSREYRLMQQSKYHHLPFLQQPITRFKRKFFRNIKEVDNESMHESNGEVIRDESDDDSYIRMPNNN